MKRIVLILAMLIALGALGVAANAVPNGQIDLWLTAPTPGNFEVYASMGSALGDRGSFGIAALGFTVTGFLTLENWAPAAGGKVWTSSTVGAAQTVGFSNVASDGVSPGQEGAIEVSQQLDPYKLVVGFGQIAGDLEPLFPNIVASKKSPYPCTTLFDPGMQPVYGAPLLIAMGTYSLGSGGPALLPVLGNGMGNYLLSDVLNSQGVADTDIGTVKILTTVIPEPSSILALLSGLAGVGGLAIRRKRA